jgi:predicted N-acetyltransferase YhbS
MLAYAEKRLCAVAAGSRELQIFINDRDARFQEIAAARGYRKEGGSESMSQLAVADLVREVSLPEGFRLKSLAEEDDLRKVHRVLWRGFDHGDEPPEGGLEERRFMQSAPRFRKDLQIVVEASGGGLAAYCGLWFEPVQRIAYVEPVATDPDYRRMGLGRAAVLEGIRRCGALGATVAYVATAMPFYLSLGFQPIYASSPWRRAWTGGP